MLEKEIAEVRRTLSLKRSTIDRIYGCYVNAAGEIITLLEQAVTMMSEEENERYLLLLRRLLSGAPEKNLFDIPFSTKEVTESEQHALLMRLYRSHLEDAEAREALFRRIIAGYKSEENYVILLAMNRYDYRRRDRSGEEAEESDHLYSFLVAGIFPTRAIPAQLAYDPEVRSFATLGGQNALTAPVAGMLFPTFDNREANIYDALFYTRSAEESHGELTDALFGHGIFMPAAEQGRAFRGMVSDALGEECRFEVAKALHGQIATRIAEHKESRDPEPLTLTCGELRDMLEDAGVTGRRLDQFCEEFGESFGANRELSPRNLVDPRRFEMKLPDVTVKATPDGIARLQTRVIDGVGYLLIRADGDLEVNGMRVSVAPEDEQDDGGSQRCNG